MAMLAPHCTFPSQRWVYLLFALLHPLHAHCFQVWQLHLVTCCFVRRMRFQPLFVLNLGSSVAHSRWLKAMGLQVEEVFAVNLVLLLCV